MNTDNWVMIQKCQIMEMTYTSDEMIIRIY